MTTSVLGFKISMPIMIAPTAMQKMAHPDGIVQFDSSNPYCILYVVFSDDINILLYKFHCAVY
jgi:hypothetical protein